MCYIIHVFSICCLPICIYDYVVLMANKIIFYKTGLPQKVPLQPLKPYFRVRQRPDLQLHEHLNQKQQTHHHPTPQRPALRWPLSRHTATYRITHNFRILQHLPPRILLQEIGHINESDINLPFLRPCISSKACSRRSSKIHYTACFILKASACLKSRDCYPIGRPPSSKSQFKSEASQPLLTRPKK